MSGACPTSLSHHCDYPIIVVSGACPIVVVSGACPTIVISIIVVSGACPIVVILSLWCQEPVLPLSSHHCGVRSLSYHCHPIIVVSGACPTIVIPSLWCQEPVLSLSSHHCGVRSLSYHCHPIIVVSGACPTIVIPSLWCQEPVLPLSSHHCGVRSLSYQLAQQWVLSVVRALDDQQQAPVVAVTVEFLAATITHRSLAPAMTVPSFVLEVCGELQRAVKVSHNAPALRCLLEEIRLCANKITPCHA
ncbi:hypothetical protein ACOMHN_016431 [Nucella lapillus]